MKKDSTNVYICKGGHSIGTKAREKGVTPMFIQCPLCGVQANSTMGRLPADDIAGEWIKPTEKELENYLRQVLLQYPEFSEDDDFIEGVTGGAKDHTAQGGLIIIWKDDPVVAKREEIKIKPIK